MSRNPPRTTLRCVISVCLLAFAFGGANRPAQGLSLFSGRENKAETIPQRPLPPLYATVALSNDEARPLAVMFEASDGTATGYDTVRTRFGPLEDVVEGKKVTAKVTKKGVQVTCKYPGFDVDVPFGEGENRTTGSCNVRFCFCSANAKNETFCLFTTTKIRHGSADWEYAYSGRMKKPTESAEKAPLMKLAGKPELAVTTKPDPSKRGQLGIGLELKTGENAVSCKRNGKTLTADVVIKTREGKVVHKATDTIDKFAFG